MRAGAPEEIFAAVGTAFPPEETAAPTFAIVAVNGWNRVAVGLGLDVLSRDGLDLPGQASCSSTRRPSPITTIRGSSAESALASDRPCSNHPFLRRLAPEPLTGVFTVAVRRSPAEGGRAPPPGHSQGAAAARA